MDEGRTRVQRSSFPVGVTDGPRRGPGRDALPGPGRRAPPRQGGPERTVGGSPLRGASQPTERTAVVVVAITAMVAKNSEA